MGTERRVPPGEASGTQPSSHRANHPCAYYRLREKTFPTTHLTRDGRPGRPHWICSPGACRNRSLACPAPRDKVAICWSGYRNGARLQLRNGSVPARRRVGGPEQGPKPTLSIRGKPRDQHGPIWTLKPQPVVPSCQPNGLPARAQRRVPGSCRPRPYSRVGRAPQPCFDSNSSWQRQQRWCSHSVAGG